MKTHNCSTKLPLYVVILTISVAVSVCAESDSAPDNKPDPVVAKLRSVQADDRDKFKPIEDLPPAEEIEISFASGRVDDPTEPVPDFVYEQGPYTGYDSPANAWADVECPACIGSSTAAGVYPYRPGLASTLRRPYVQAFVDAARRFVATFADPRNGSIDRAYDSLLTLKLTAWEAHQLNESSAQFFSDLQAFLDGATPRDVVDSLRSSLANAQEGPLANKRQELADTEQKIRRLKETFVAHRAEVLSFEPELEEVVEEFLELKSAGHQLEAELDAEIREASNSDSTAQLVRRQRAIRTLPDDHYVQARELRLKVRRLRNKLNAIQSQYASELGQYQMLIDEHDLQPPAMAPDTRWALNQILAYTRRHYTDVKTAVNHTVGALETRRVALERERTRQRTDQPVREFESRASSAKFEHRIRELTGNLHADGPASPIPGLRLQRRRYQRLKEYNALIRSCEQTQLQAESWRETGCNLAVRQRSLVQSELANLPARLKLQINVLRAKELSAPKARLNEIEMLLTRNNLGAATRLYDEVLKAGLE